MCLGEMAPILLILQHDELPLIRRSNERPKIVAIIAMLLWWITLQQYHICAWPNHSILDCSFIGRRWS